MCLRRKYRHTAKRAAFASLSEIFKFFRAVRAQQAPQVTPGQGTPASLSILVVDDNVDAAQLLAVFLDGAGCRVAVEHDPAYALEEAAQDRFRAFLLREWRDV